MKNFEEMSFCFSFWNYMVIFCNLISLNSTQQQPHIIFMLADDLGWNDVSFHGSNEIPTPNIDAMGYYGLILNKYYVNHICTPSRSALMTGRYPIHTGMQHFVLSPREHTSLPHTEVILPQHLKKLGYATHALGKWHLGMYHKEDTPIYRGFDSHLGFWAGLQDYFDHTYMEESYWGLDMRRNLEPAWDLHGQYSTDIYTKEAVNIISKHNASQPLFLYIAHAATHWGNPYNLIPALDEEAAKFHHIPDYNRSRYAGVMSRLDQSVGKVVEALQDAKMLENSIVIFTTDNGGSAHGFDMTASSNWPLRGTKYTLWEGGVRGSAVMWSKSLSKPGRVSNQVMHLVDWLPTFYCMAGGDIDDLGSIDGVNVWNALSKDMRTDRFELLHNIDWIDKNAALTVGDWKIIIGAPFDEDCSDQYHPQNEDDFTTKYDIDEVLNSPAGMAFASNGQQITADEIINLRNEATIKCDAYLTFSDEYFPPCKPTISPCLFNIKRDPCEKQNLAERYPEKLQTLLNILSYHNETVVEPINYPLFLDPRSDPQFWNYTWTTFGDYI